MSRMLGEMLHYELQEHARHEPSLMAVAAPAVPAAVLALRLYQVYEGLAPFGHETRAFDPESANGRLMIAVAAELLAWLALPV